MSIKDNQMLFMCEFRRSLSFSLNHNIFKDYLLKIIDKNLEMTKSERERKRAKMRAVSVDEYACIYGSWVLGLVLFLSTIQDVYYMPEATTFYAIFTTGSNDVAGSAVCSYSLTNVDIAFKGSFTYQENLKSTWQAVQNPNAGISQVSSFFLLSIKKKREANVVVKGAIDSFFAAV